MTKITLKFKPDESETHPWARFPETNNATKLILGSFPPQRFTDNHKNLKKNDLDFFYGSKENAFWNLFCKAQNTDINCQNIESLKNYLEKNNWIVSDIILKTKRTKISALDRDLDVQLWNIETIKDILNTNKIEIIYFTSKWVYEHFYKYIAHHFEKIPKTVILISPSKNGLMSLNWAREIYKQLQTENNTEYRERYYSHFLNL